MGEFKAGNWIIGLSIYFFVFFLIVTAVISGLDELGEDRSGLRVTDPGYLTDDLSGECQGFSPIQYCELIPGGSPTVCALHGCGFNSTTLACSGGLIAATSCVQFQNQTTCETGGCTWVGGTDYNDLPGNVNPDDSFDWSSVKNSVLVMAGFTADIGLPGEYQFIFSFIFFWIPLMMLLWSLYMALPFLH